MSLTLFSSMRPFFSPFVRSEALVASLRMAFEQYCSFRAAVDQALLENEAVQTAGQLAQSLSQLPPGLLAPESLRELEGLIPSLHEQPEGLGEVMRISDGIFQSHWYASPPAALTRLIGTSKPQGQERLFAGSAVPVSKCLVEYEVVANDGEVIPPVPPDAPQVNMHGYRLIEAAAFHYYLRPEAPERVILAPGFTGTGKTDHLTPHLLSSLKTRGAKPLYIDLMDRNTGMGLLKRFMRTMLEPILILDEVCLLKGHEEAKLRDHLRKYVRDGRRVILIGGGFQSTNGQRILLNDLIADLFPKEIRGIVPIHVKPLNRMQSAEILNSDCHLNLKDRMIFTDFVLERLPPYLRVLRKFRLPSEIDRLEDAFLNFQWAWEEDLPLILSRACLRPKGSTDGEFTSPELKKVSDRLEEDYRRILRE